MLNTSLSHWTTGNAENEKLKCLLQLPELKGAILRTKCTSPGEDNISAAFFKGLNKNSLKLLLQTQQYLEFRKYPSVVNVCHHFANPKPGIDKKEVASYRPIALTSVACKTCERIIASRISNHILEKNILNHRHLGFQPYRDNHTISRMLHQAIVQAKRAEKLILGDITWSISSVDSVYVDGLILQCAQIGITCPIIRWDTDFYLLEASRCTGEFSTSRTIGRGVP